MTKYRECIIEQFIDDVRTNNVYTSSGHLIDRAYRSKMPNAVLTLKYDDGTTWEIGESAVLEVIGSCEFDDQMED